MKKTKVLSLFSVLPLLLTLSACGGAPHSSAGTSSSAPMPSAESAAPYYDAAPDGGSAVFNTEEYSAIQENGFRPVASAPLSTFSADVDTASYSNVRRMLLDGSAVPPDALRIEECINYFRYDYPAPEEGLPFSLTTELSACPWNDETNLLLVGLQARDLDYESLPRSNLVFLLDVSGSMDEPNKLPLVKQAFRLLSENLRADDTISIVTYASGDKVVLDGASGAEAFEIVDVLDSLVAAGSTDGSKGILTAYELAEKHFIKGGNNRVILATDGDLNVGLTSEGELTRLAEQKRESGVYLSVLGFGEGNLKDNKMEALADSGNGNYAYIDSLLEAKKVLVEELGGTLFTVAKDVKLQLEFNPAQIKGYRLIGYENRLLNDEDFQDDTKDAGEIGAGHRVTALYELVPADSEMEISSAPELKYQQPSDATGSEEWLTVSVRYKDPQGEESEQISTTVDSSIYSPQLSENLSFAAGVAQFGMLLRSSEYAGTSDFDGVIERLSALPSAQNDEYKKEFLYLLERAKRIGVANGEG